MRTGVIQAARVAEILDVPEPEPAAGEVLVRVLACGVCGSDLTAWRGVPGVDLPLAAGAPGHEGWGQVAATESPAFQTGQLVTGLMQNGYAQYAVGAADQLMAVPAAFHEKPLLGEPLACAANVVRRAGVQAGDRVAVVGFGYLAALPMQLLTARTPVEWVAIARRSESRELARQLGASAAYDFAAAP